MNKRNPSRGVILFWNACLIATGLVIAALLVLAFFLPGQVSVR